MISREPSHKEFQIDALDGLRGLAALIVVASHTSNNGWYFVPFADFSGIGKTGVYLFFILSSFLLTLPLLHKGSVIFERKEFTRFWKRRFFRIFPLYTVYLASGLASTYVLSNMAGIHGVGVPFTLSLDEFIKHITLQQGKSVTWSIVVEFKFYFILPFIAYFLSVLFKRNAYYALLTLAIGIVALHNYFPPEELNKASRHELMPYMPIFLIGMGMAVIQYKINQAGGLSANAELVAKLFSYGSLAIIFIMIPSVFSFLFYEVLDGAFQNKILVYSILWAVVLFASINTSGILNKILSHKTVRYFGFISFSLYLIHPVFIGVLRYSGLETPLNAWFVVAASTLAAHISFMTIEAPCSRIRVGSALRVSA